MGNGKNVNFWYDAWVDGKVLKESFPRIFTLARNKNGKVIEYGRRNGNCWEWFFELRRPVFDWERHQWDELHLVLKDFTLIDEMEDRLIWKSSPSGFYTSSSFCKALMSQSYEIIEEWKFIWAGLAPPKVEFLVWQIMKNRMAVKRSC